MLEFVIKFLRLRFPNISLMSASCYNGYLTKIGHRLAGKSKFVLRPQVFEGGVDS